MQPIGFAFRWPCDPHLRSRPLNWYYMAKVKWYQDANTFGQKLCVLDTALKFLSCQMDGQDGWLAVQTEKKKEKVKKDTHTKEEKKIETL